nr:uncharacterized protein LOC111423972 [Onthophagus taurus]
MSQDQFVIPQSAFDRVVEDFYKTNPLDQYPIKFPDDQHVIKSTPTTSTLQSILEITSQNATQEITTASNAIMTSTNATNTNLTSLINEVFVNNSTSTEATITNLTSSTSTNILTEITDFKGETTTNLIDVVNSTLRGVNVNTTDYLPEEHHYHKDNTGFIILGVVLVVLVISIIVGFALYYRKKNMIMKSEGQHYRQSGNSHVIQFSDEQNCSGNGQQTQRNR